MAHDVVGALDLLLLHWLLYAAAATLKTSRERTRRGAGTWRGGRAATRAKSLRAAAPRMSASSANAGATS